MAAASTAGCGRCEPRDDPAVMDDVAAELALSTARRWRKSGRSERWLWHERPYALAAARAIRRVVAAASFYGTWLSTEAEESPHLSLGRSRRAHIRLREHAEDRALPMGEE